MSYVVTGATGFIGRHLVRELIDHREGEVFVVVRESSLPRMEALAARPLPPASRRSRRRTPRASLPSLTSRRRADR